MKNKLQFFYKLFWICFFVIKNSVCTLLFRILLFINDVDFGTNVKTGGAIPQVRINRKKKCVKLGNNVSFNNYNDVAWCLKCAIWVKEGATLVIEDGSGLNGALVYVTDSVFIGKNVKIGGGTKIFDTDFHPLSFEIRRTSNNGTKSAPIFIEDDVFIGTSCLILKGVHIGARSIVAAGSVVVKSIPSDEIWGGNPAKFIKKI